MFFLPLDVYSIEDLGENVHRNQLWTEIRTRHFAFKAAQKICKRIHDQYYVCKLFESSAQSQVKKDNKMISMEDNHRIC